MKTPDALLTFSHFRVQHANTISSPLTWGFPAVSAILGAVHALQRWSAEKYDLTFDGVGIVCHHYETQTYQPGGQWNQYFTLARHPLTSKGETAAITEEGRIHLELSLVIGVYGTAWDKDEAGKNELAQELFAQFCTQHFAGGTIVRSHVSRSPYFVGWVDGEKETLSRRQLSKLLPGFALISRHDLLQQRAQETGSNLDAFLDFCSLRRVPKSVQTGEGQPPEVRWEIEREAGWLVPIPVGFTGISPCYAPGEVKHTRDPAYSAQFVESIYSLGEWRSPHRFKDIRDIFWYQHYDADKSLYLCVNPDK